MMILGFETFDFFVFIVISLLICITLCTLAMEASVLFLPAFLFLFPFIITNFPDVTPNEAIGLAITIEFFGYTSSVTGYWLRGQVDFRLAMRVLAITVPLATGSSRWSRIRKTRIRSLVLRSSCGRNCFGSRISR